MFAAAQPTTRRSWREALQLMEQRRAGRSPDKLLWGVGGQQGPEQQEGDGGAICRSRTSLRGRVSFFPDTTKCNLDRQFQHKNLVVSQVILNNQAINHHCGHRRTHRNGRPQAEVTRDLLKNLTLAAPEHVFVSLLHN